MFGGNKNMFMYTIVLKKNSTISFTMLQDSVMDVTKEKKVDLAIPRDYNYFLYDAEPYLAEADIRVRRTPFARKKPSRPIQQHVRIGFKK